MAEPLAGDAADYGDHTGHGAFPAAFERQARSGGFFGGAATGRAFD